MSLACVCLFLQVHSHVDVFDFSSNKWVDQIKMPKEMAHSHLGIASDGRYIYIISGQYGIQCSGPTTASFSLDTATKKWKPLPPLPAPRCAINICISTALTHLLFVNVCCMLFFELQTNAVDATIVVVVMWLLQLQLWQQIAI